MSAITLNIPDELHERLSQFAEENNRSIEAVLMQSAALLLSYDDSTQSVDDALQLLSTYSDEQLWAVIYRRLTPGEPQRIQELLHLGTLSQVEEKELDGLVGLNDRYMLLRSEALLLLKNRGHDIERYLETGIR